MSCNGRAGQPIHRYAKSRNGDYREIAVSRSNGKPEAALSMPFLGFFVDLHALRFARSSVMRNASPMQ